MINVVLAFMIIGSFLVAVIIHEFGHSLVATMLGDPTSRKEGRLFPSLRTHIDPVGTMLCVILAFFRLLLVRLVWAGESLLRLIPGNCAVGQILERY